VADTVSERPSFPFGASIPFVEHLGFVLTEFGDGRSCIEYRPQPEHLNSLAMTHGGAVMTLLDVTMATASRSIDKSLAVITIEMKTTFMRPALPSAQGQPLQCRGRLMHRTRTLAFAEATLFDERGEACAHATGTFKYVTRGSGSA
jgi:uncharacterized protein (TIGR00369 family)